MNADNRAGEALRAHRFFTREAIRSAFASLAYFAIGSIGLAMALTTLNDSRSDADLWVAISWTLLALSVFTLGSALRECLDAVGAFLDGRHAMKYAKTGADKEQSR